MSALPLPDEAPKELNTAIHQGLRHHPRPYKGLFNTVLQGRLTTCQNSCVIRSRLPVLTAIGNPAYAVYTKQLVTRNTYANGDPE